VVRPDRRPVKADWGELADLVNGRVLGPGDPGFAEASQAFNKRYASVRPARVLSAASVSDVAKAIIWARDHGMPITPRGGGHSYAGFSLAPDGLVLDLRGLDDMRIDAETGLVTVGGGTRMGALYAALQPHDLAIPLGNSDDVGIGGLVLGGGVLAVSRAFGLTCDALIETEVVLADGTVVTANATEHPDLFWACRGGGGGNFGVNTSFTFRTRPTMDSSTCLLLWHGEHARDVLIQMQEVMRRAPNLFAARLGISRAAGEDGVMSVIGQHLGPAGELREILGPALAVATPFRADIEDKDYWQAKDYLHHITSGDPFAARTRCASEPLSEAGVVAAVAAVEKWPGSGNPDGAGVALFTWGGAINQVPATATAFPHRDALFLVSMDTSWSAGDSPEVAADNLAWLSALYEEMGEFATDAAYVNFTDPDLAGWQNAYYGPNLARLIDVKCRYDPDRVFSFPQAL